MQQEKICMARKSRITEQQIEIARKKLIDLPLKDTSKSTREAIEFLAKNIQEAVNKGYTLSEISSILQSQGISIQASTLKAYLGRGGNAEKNVLSEKDKQKAIKIDTPSDKNFVRQDTPIDDL